MDVAFCQSRRLRLHRRDPVRITLRRTIPRTTRTTCAFSFSGRRCERSVKAARSPCAVPPKLCRGHGYADAFFGAAPVYQTVPLYAVHRPRSRQVFLAIFAIQKPGAHCYGVPRVIVSIAQVINWSRWLALPRRWESGLNVQVIRQVLRPKTSIKSLRSATRSK